MNEEKYDVISRKLSESNAGMKKDEETVVLAREYLQGELTKRNIRYNKDVVDIYPHCIKVEKETMDYPMYRAAIEATRDKMKEDFNIDLELYSF